MTVIYKYKDGNLQMIGDVLIIEKHADDILVITERHIHTLEGDRLELLEVSIPK